MSMGVEPNDRIETVRQFNRFYTRRIGILQEGLLTSPFSLTEARVLWELAHREHTTAAELARDLGLDAAYMSRIVRRFQKRGLLRKQRSTTDARRNELALKDRGRATFEALNEASRREVGELLTRLSEEEQRRLVGAMSTIERLLDGPAGAPSYILRPPDPGDLGWVVHRHGVLYHEEYGWDERFEALSAELVARFVQNFDARRERCWIAEREGENVGSVFLVKRTETVGQLRMLLVEPKARGLGIGKRLVQECTRFARGAGYERIVLWTSPLLIAARKLYEAEGYHLIEEKPHDLFGEGLVGQTWEMVL